MWVSEEAVRGEDIRGGVWGNVKSTDLGYERGKEVIPGGRRRRGGGVLDSRDILDLMHGRSRMTLDPHILAMQGRSLSGFHRPDRHCLHQA